MTKIGSSSYNKYCHNTNFKGKQTTKVYDCGCCWCINDRKEKLNKIALKEMSDEKDQEN